MTIKNVKNEMETIYQKNGFYEPSEIMDLARKARDEEPGIALWDVISAMMSLARDTNTLTD